MICPRCCDVPFVKLEKRIETKDYGAGFFRVILRYGFMEDIDVPAAHATLLHHTTQKSVTFCHIVQASASN